MPANGRVARLIARWLIGRQPLASGNSACEKRRLFGSATAFLSTGFLSTDGPPVESAPSGDHGVESGFDRGGVRGGVRSIELAVIADGGVWEPEHSQHVGDNAG